MDPGVLELPGIHTHTAYCMPPMYARIQDQMHTFIYILLNVSQNRLKSSLDPKNLSAGFEKWTPKGRLTIIRPIEIDG